MKLREAPDDLFALISQASAQLDLPIGQVEKDFWAVELLRSVARPIDGGRVVFKGGTSLSKAFRLIERFSEDIDILLVPNPGLGKGPTDALLKSIAERVGLDLGMPGELKESTRAIKRNVRYPYPVSYPSDDLTEGVLLEMGIRGGPEPSGQEEIRSYVAEVALGRGLSVETFEEFAAVSIDTLVPERTLIEKLALVHDLAVRHVNAAHFISDKGRHLYDIWALLGSHRVRDALAEPGFAARISEDRVRVSALFDLPTTPRPASGFAASPAFDPTDPSAPFWEAAYESAMGLVWGTKPTLNDCLGRVQEYKHLL